jgi:hypothetical protein
LGFLLPCPKPFVFQSIYEFLAAETVNLNVTSSVEASQIQVAVLALQVAFAVIFTLSIVSRIDR